jgi:hypothetical protein
MREEQASDYVLCSTQMCCGSRSVGGAQVLEELKTMDRLAWAYIVSHHHTQSHIIRPRIALLRPVTAEK